LIHNYFGVDYDVVWMIISDDLKDLREDIRTIIDEF